MDDVAQAMSRVGQLRLGPRYDRVALGSVQPSVLGKAPSARPAAATECTEDEGEGDEMRPGSIVECTSGKVTVTTGRLVSVFNAKDWTVPAELIAMMQESLLSEQETTASLAKQRDEARAAARWLYKWSMNPYAPFAAKEKWPWLEESDDRTE